MSLRINIPESINNETIGSSFNSLFLDIILQMEESDEEEIIWDFSKTQILNPFFILPLLLYKNRCGCNVQIENMPERTKLYFKAIHFFDICDADSMGEDGFKVFIDGYKEKRYIPITRFPACSKKDRVRDNIVSAIGNILKEQLSIKGNLYTGLSYLLSEIIDNITEHSCSDYGYIFAQYYKKSQYIDICIVDEGITLLGSYLNNANIKGIETDLDAIKNASIGVSTKNRPDAENRGYGIVTSRKMLVDGLKGQFFLFSGGAFYRYHHDGVNSHENYIGLPSKIKWDGTIVLLRVPYNDNDSFNYIKYLEG